MTRPAFLAILAILAVGVGSCFADTTTQPITIKNAAQPQLAVAADGRVWLTYAHGADVFVTHSTNGGESFAPPVKVANVPKLMLGMRRGPRIAAHGDRVTVTVIAHELLAFTSVDGGETWTGPVTINDVATSAREGLHDLAGAPDGQLFVTWLDLRNGSMELWGAASTDGGLTWGKDERVYKSPGKSICECCHPNALFDDEGNLAVMWRNSIEGSRDMWLATRPKDAENYTQARRLGENTWILNACPMDGGEIVALGSGGFGAVWQRNGEIFFSLSTGAETSLGEGVQPVAVQDDSQILAVWQDKGNLVLRQGLDGEAKTLTTSARFPSLIKLPNDKGALLAYESRSKEGAPTVTIHQL